jgi:hypothetical protein
MSSSSSKGGGGTGGGGGSLEPMQTDPMQTSSSASSSSSQNIPAVDINTLAAMLQQVQKQNQQSQQQASQQQASQQQNQQNQQQPDMQAILMEMQRLKNERDALERSYKEEQAKSKVLVEDKKKEMESFLGGIADFVNKLDGVKDPESKTKFMDGLKNMANHGVPNGIFDIMVSASAQNAVHLRTIEDLTQSYSALKNRYEGAGPSFAAESSRIVDPTLSIVNSAGDKRKAPETGAGRVPIGMWDAFGEDIAKVGYGQTQEVWLQPTPANAVPPP